MLLLAACHVMATDVRTVFANVPDSIFPLLTANNKLDLIDLYDNKIEAKVKNRLDEATTLTHMTDEYLRVQLSASTMAEMRVLTLNDSVDLVLLCKSFVAGGRESSLTIYTSDWHAADSLVVPCPKVEDFVTSISSEDSERMACIVAQLNELPLVAATISPDEDVVTFSIDLGELDKDDKRLAKSYVHPISYRWVDGSFCKQ